MMLQPLRQLPVLVNQPLRGVVRTQLLRSYRRQSSATALVCRAAADSLLRSLSVNQEVAVLVLDATNTVAEGATRHGTGPTATAALGRTMMGALLFAAFKKDGTSVHITFSGDGELGGVLAIADTHGNVRGRVGNPNVDPPLRPDGKLNVGAAVGQGRLNVVRTHPLDAQPYSGIVDIHNGEIAEDLAMYLAQSEQTNSALALGVQIGRDLSVRAAGGYLVQVLPFASDATVEALERNIAAMPAITDALSQGMTPADITNALLADLGVDSSYRVELTPRYGPCDEDDLKERMKRAVISLGPREIQSILDDVGKVEVKCDLCNVTVQFTEDDVQEVLTKSAA